MRGFTIETLLTDIPNAFAKGQKNSKNVNLGLFIEFLGRLGSIFSKKMQKSVLVKKICAVTEGRLRFKSRKCASIV